MTIINHGNLIIGGAVGIIVNILTSWEYWLMSGAGKYTVKTGDPSCKYLDPKLPS
jgi:hypothetical protein